MTGHDRFAHLRANLETYRSRTSGAQVIAWCRACELHHAPEPGALCPVCESEPSAA